MIENIFRNQKHPIKLSSEFIPKNDWEKEKLIIGGPCAIESYEQLLDIAQFMKNIGVKVLRGGAYKPRTSPHTFQGLGEEGLKILSVVRKQVGLLCVTEAVDEKSLEKVAEVADMIQIGSRNMQNFSLLKEAGRQSKPILLKRGMAATIQEWIRAAEYIATQGNTNIILCERGIRSFDSYTRNVLDLAAVPIIKKETGLPVIVDPSHGTGLRDLIKPMSLAAMAVGADGLMIEVHRYPDQSISDSIQTIDFQEFESILYAIR